MRRGNSPPSSTQTHRRHPSSVPALGGFLRCLHKRSLQTYGGLNHTSSDVKTSCVTVRLCVPVSSPDPGMMKMERRRFVHDGLKLFRP